MRLLFDMLDIVHGEIISPPYTRYVIPGNKMQEILVLFSMRQQWSKQQMECPWLHSCNTRCFNGDFLEIYRTSICFTDGRHSRTCLSLQALQTMHTSFIREPSRENVRWNSLMHRWKQTSKFYPSSCFCVLNAVIQVFGPKQTTKKSVNSSLVFLTVG